LGAIAAYAPLVANRAAISTWEKFTWTDVGAGQATLKASTNGKFVSADQNRASYLVADRTTAGGWETFTWGTGTTTQPTAVPTTPSTGWNLVWSDEFNGSGAINTANWNFDLGAGGWGNGEWETYTNSTANVYQDGAGNLVIKAIKNGSTYTSGRIHTAGKRQFTYAKVEMRARLPYGQGIWPAFWMLGATGGGWPNNGEIDIMENIGKASEQNIIHGTIHGPGYSGGSGIGAAYTGPRFADGFHTFAVEWENNVIRWYVDGNLYQTRTNASIPAGTQWVFNHNFYIILNLAVGGAWPGYPDASTVFPQTYTVDYVRVYQR
jgi:beta-glucanase (GH16 family)